LLAGAYCSTDGHANPIWTTKAFADAAARHGAQVLERTPVTGLLVEGGRVRGVQTPDGPLAADRVIVAAGVWSERLCANIGVTLPIEPDPPQMLLTTPFPHGLDPVIGCVGKLLSLKQLRTGQYLVGGGWPASAYLDRERPIALNRESSVTGSAATCAAVWPVLREASVMRVWAGLEARAADDVPILGDVSGIDGLLVATGFSGHGFALSPYIGVLLAELATTGQTPIPIDDLALTRFQTGGTHVSA
jgi:sarcosine oxidase subunit beta